MPPRRVIPDFPEDDIKGQITVKAGERDKAPRALIGAAEFEFDVELGYNIFAAIIKTKVESILEDSEKEISIENDSIYIKPSKNATQARFVQLTSANWKPTMEKFWKNQYSYNRDRPDPDPASIVFEFFVYGIEEITSERTIQRATQRNIALATERIQAYERSQGQEIPVLARSYAVVSDARRPGPSNRTFTQEDLDELANDPTFQQLSHVDELVRGEIGRVTQPADDFMEIPVEINGVRFPIKVDIGALKEALELPSYSLLSPGVTRGVTPPSVLRSANIEDQDHDPDHDLGAPEATQLD
jgi:hypothetical protein